VQAVDPRRAGPLLAILAVLKLVLQALALAAYGWFRDELYYVACSERLAFGYVDHRPLSIAVLRLWRALFGDSLAAMRLAPALAGAAIDVLGRRARLPRAISGHNNYWLWGFGGREPTAMILLGGKRERLEREFVSITQVTTVERGLCMPYENHKPVWVDAPPTFVRHTFSTGGSRANNLRSLTTSTGIPDDVQRFLVENIDSIAQLEVFLLLWVHRARRWTAQEISTELRSSVVAAQLALESLHAKKLLDIEAGAPSRYRFAASGARLDQLAVAVDHVYQERRLAVISLIYAKPEPPRAPDPVRDFADAFKLKKGTRDG
jgi:hypothetical protein